MIAALVLKVGYLKKSIIDKLKINLNPGEIYLLQGGLKHIERKRKNFFQEYINLLPDVIKNPDYIGTNPKYKNSVEFIKKVKKNVLVAIRSNEFGTLSVVTMFEVTNAKINRMLKHNRIFNIK
jgi:hypothetical protein